MTALTFMRLLPALALVLFALLPPAHAETKKPTTPACGPGTATPCAPAMPVVNVSIQADAAKVQAAMAANEKPMEGWFTRNPWMRWLAWYAAITFLVSIVALTVWSVLDSRKNLPRDRR